jgi:hypothetical protein
MSDLQFRQTDVLETSATPYGDFTTVARDNRISVSSERPLSNQSDNFTSGVTHDSSESRFRLRANDSTESLETIDSLQYTPGYIAEIGIALQIPEAPTGGQEVRWGYWDGDDGVYFGWDSEGVFIERLRGGTRVGKTYEDDWSAELPPDAPTALMDGTITRLALALYNYGGIEFELFTENKETDALEGTKVHNAPVKGGTTLSKQDNPIRVEVDNPDTSDFDVFVADRQATVRGQFTPNRRVKGERREGVALSGTTWVPVLSFRRKEAFKTVNTTLFNLLAKPDVDIYLQVREDAGSTTDADYSAPQNVQASETTVEVDTTPSGSISDGYFVYQTQFEAASNNKSQLGELANVDLQLKNARPMTVFVRTVSASGGTIEAFNVNWAENW